MASEATELQMLGGFALSHCGVPVDVPECSQRVLVYLALRDRPQARHLVAASLWPDSSETRAAANLRSSLWRLPTPGGKPLCETKGHILGISPDVTIDVRRVESLGWSLVHEHSRVALDNTRTFFEELLPGWYEDFVLLERERLAQLRLHFLEAMAAELLEQGRHAEALDIALRLVSADALRERSQRILIEVFRAEGSIGQAVRQYEQYRTLLQETFQCDPSQSLRNLAYNPPTESA
jgi:DNA-binding SARP family transcriptional activator